MVGMYMIIIIIQMLIMLLTYQLNSRRNSHTEALTIPHMSARGGGASTPCLIQDVFVTKRFGAPGTTTLWPFNQHTYSWEAKRSSKI